jgi:RNA polymerase sigma-70 factor (ECF subfamily)
MFDLTTKIELKQGSPAAYKVVFRLLYPRLKAYCQLFISDKSQVEDIIQESFITLWEKRENIRPEKSIESLVFVMVRNRCLNVLKKKQVEDGSFDLDNIHLTNKLQYLYHLDFNGKEEKSLEEELIESFKTAVNDLPPKMKLVYTRCKMEGQKQTDIAKELGISLKMVEKHVSKAKKLIKRKLLTQYPALIILVTFLLE